MKKGRGYREFLACRDEIIELLAAGHPVRHIWNILSSQGKITTQYRNFFFLLNKFSVKPIQLERLKTGAEVAAEQAEEGARKPPGNRQKPADPGSLPAKPEETKDDRSFGLEKKKENEVF